MPNRPSFTTRALVADDTEAEAMARRAGAHGIYVTNAFANGECDGFVCSHDGRDSVLCWFGARGNVVLIGPDELEPAAIAAVIDQILQRRRSWRIVMGPRPLVEALRARTAAKPLVLRDQVYYRGSAATAAQELVRGDVRAAERADRDRLVQATLLLNASDLHIPPSQVDRRWLRDTIDERIADGTTRVLGPVGSVHCKLDLGSRGPGGTVIEGVFTFPEQRGRGLAAALVASQLAAEPGASCLHVGVHNAPARAAYARAGMAEVGRCHLLLLG
ncbi:MAG: GNAT family N-acetyltransferase [Planctomycetes bacterium]|nr:GNAT family N-acetyltransferase [Planctomycetota bacterium]